MSTSYSFTGSSENTLSHPYHATIKEDPSQQIPNGLPTLHDTARLRSVSVSQRENKDPELVSLDKKRMMLFLLTYAGNSIKPMEIRISQMEKKTTSDKKKKRK